MKTALLSIFCLVSSVGWAVCCPQGQICNSVNPNELMPPCTGAGIINPPNPDSPGWDPFASAPAPVIATFDPAAAQQYIASQPKQANYAKCQQDRSACGEDNENCYKTYLQCIGDPYGSMRGECVNQQGAVLYVNDVDHRTCVVCPRKLQDICGFPLTPENSGRFDALPKWAKNDYHKNAFDGPCEGCPASW